MENTPHWNPLRTERAVIEAETYTRRPFPPPLVFGAVGVLLAFGLAGLLTLLAIYGAHSPASVSLYAIAGLVLLASAGTLLSGAVQRRNMVTAAYTAGLELAAIESSIKGRLSKPTNPLELESSATLIRVQDFLINSGAHRQAEELARVRAGVADVQWTP